MEADKAVINDIRCKYNQGVICSAWTTKSTAAKCDKCGWHKGVSTARLNARGLYWEIQRKKWLKQLQPHKVRRDPEADDDKKHNKPPIRDFLGQRLMALHKYYYFSKAGFMLLSEQPDGTGRTLIGEDPNLSYLIYMHRAYSFHHVKEIYDYYDKTCLVIIPPDDG